MTRFFSEKSRQNPWASFQTGTNLASGVEAGPGLRSNATGSSTGRSCSPAISRFFPDDGPRLTAALAELRAAGTRAADPAARRPRGAEALLRGDHRQGRVHRARRGDRGRLRPSRPERRTAGRGGRSRGSSPGWRSRWQSCSPSTSEPAAGLTCRSRRGAGRDAPTSDRSRRSVLALSLAAALVVLRSRFAALGAGAGGPGRALSCRSEPSLAFHRRRPRSASASPRGCSMRATTSPSAGSSGLRPRPSAGGCRRHAAASGPASRDAARASRPQPNGSGPDAAFAGGQHERRARARREPRTERQGGAR